MNNCWILDTEPEEFRFVAEGYLIDFYTGERISNDFKRPTKGISFEQAKNRTMFGYKTQVLGLNKNYKVDFVGEIRTIV